MILSVKVTCSGKQMHAKEAVFKVMANTYVKCPVKHSMVGAGRLIQAVHAQIGWPLTEAD